jgi:oxygen-dependent protoporphyrinogen oxidase
MERQHGSLFRAVRRQENQQPHSATSSSGARYSMFVAPRGGMQALIAAAAARLPAGTLQLDSPVVRIGRLEKDRWSLSMGRGREETGEFGAIVLATPAAAAAKLIEPIDTELAAELTAIPYSGCAIVSLVYQRTQIAHPLDGLGFVVPLVERRRILSGSFSSVKYAGRAPEGKVLIRVFIGGACQSELAAEPDDRLRAIATEELAELLGIRGDPSHVFISRRPASMPQYHVGHHDRLARMDERLARYRGLLLAGNAYRGVGLPHCIHSGEEAAEKAVAAMRKN